MKENGAEELIEGQTRGLAPDMMRVPGKVYPPEVEEQLQQQEAARSAAMARETREAWEGTPQGKLCLAMYEAFEAYKKYLEENPHARSTKWGYDVDFKEHKVFEHGLRAMEYCRHERAEAQRKNLEKAKAAARCEHEHLSGERCKAPRMKGGKLCRMHQRMEEAESAKLDLGPMEDPESIQVGIKKLQGAIIEGTLDHRQVAQLAYTIQLAAWNVGMKHKLTTG